jgi:hypothetical protein
MSETRIIVGPRKAGQLRTLVQGPAGPSGSGDKSYTHTQLIPSASWTVTHGLGKNPAVSVVDSAGSAVVGDIVYVNINTVTLTFSAAFAGQAFFN